MKCSVLLFVEQLWFHSFQISHPALRLMIYKKNLQITVFRDNRLQYLHDYYQMMIVIPQHSRPQRPLSFWSAPRIATSGQVQQRKSAIHGLPVTLRMLRVKSDKSDWFWSQSIVFTQSHSKPECRWTRPEPGRPSWC